MNLNDAAKHVSTTGAICRTKGDGFWSGTRRNVVIDRIETYTTEGDRDYGTKTEHFLKVFWVPRSWDIGLDGLIYTDSGWLRDFRRAMREAGYHSASKINYTEQGMQGEKYVHLIVGMW